MDFEGTFFLLAQICVWNIDLRGFYVVYIIPVPFRCSTVAERVIQSYKRIQEVTET